MNDEKDEFEYLVKDKNIILSKLEENESKILSEEIVDKISSTSNSLSKSVGAIMESLRPSIELACKSAQQMSKIVEPLQKMAESLTESLKPVIEQIGKSIATMRPYFGELAKTIEELQKNPDSVFNWINFSKSLNSYFWLPPYLMDSSELMELLKNVDSEEHMDEQLEKYFTVEIVEKLLDEIIDKSFKKHKEIMIQIRASYKNENYALVNTGLFSVIDSLCSFFVVNKKRNTYRINLFNPILKIEERESVDYYNILILSMVNANINFLYGGKKCTHKLARRHPSQHGEFFSNNKIDTIMLLHTIYYLLTLTVVYKKYEKSLETETYYVGKKRKRRYRIVKNN